MSIYIHQDLINDESLADQPLVNARICWQSVAGSVSGTSGQSNFPVSSVLNPATYERYRPIGGLYAEIIIDCLTPKAVDYLAMQLSNVSLITVQCSSDSITWTNIQIINLSGDKVVLALFQEISFRYYKIIIEGVGIEVVAMKFGKSLAMQRAIHAGNSPMNLSPRNVIRPNVSETGQWLGTSVQRVGFSASFNWDNLGDDWYRNNFDLFAKSQPRAIPFFIAWRPLTYQDDLTYCLSTSDISPSYTGTKNFMNVALSVEGFSDAT